MPLFLYWLPYVQHPSTAQELIGRLVSQSALLVIRVQVAAIYFHAAVAKMRVVEWVDGTALYYWLNSSYIGAPSYLKPLLEPLLNSGAVALVTWGALLLEIALAAGLLMPRFYRHPLLIAGILFHIAIAFLFGIMSFAVAMMAALVLYLHPTEQAFERPSIITVFRRGKLTGGEV